MISYPLSWGVAGLGAWFSAYALFVPTVALLAFSILCFREATEKAYQRERDVK